LALIVNLHGSGSSAVGEETFSGMDAAADRDTFLVAYPEGAIPLRHGFAWNVPGQPLPGADSVTAGEPDDVEFIAQAVREVERRYCVDSHRVFVTGLSGGGRLASDLACRLPAIFAAAAPVSGLRFPEACDGAPPVAIVSFHGTADLIDPYNGHGPAYWTYSVREAAGRWAVHDGCSPGGTTTTLEGGVQQLVFHCPAGAVTLYTITGAGHTWPGGPALAPGLEAWLGPESHAIDATAVMWRFFQNHPMR